MQIVSNDLKTKENNGAAMNPRISVAPMMDRIN